MGSEASSPRSKKLTLTAHIVTAVGCLGGLVACLMLGVFAVTSDDADTVNAAYIAMETIGRYVLLPLVSVSLATGLTQGFGTSWGVFKHYWIVAKLGINVVSLVLVIVFTQLVEPLAADAREAGVVEDDVAPVVLSGVLLVLLITATTLAVYKPRGRTRFGRRKQDEAPAGT